MDSQEGIEPKDVWGHLYLATGAAKFHIFLVVYIYPHIASGGAKVNSLVLQVHLKGAQVWEFRPIVFYV